MARLKARLFVESVEVSAQEKSKTVGASNGKQHWVIDQGVFGSGKVYEESSGPSFSRSAPYVFDRSAPDLVLPSDQRKTVEIVKRVASNAQLDFKVVDFGKTSVRRRLVVQKEFGPINRFPTLVLSSGKRIEGNITEQQIAQLIPTTPQRRRLFPRFSIPPKYPDFLRRTKSSAMPFYEKLIIFLRFVFFLEKDPKHGTMENETLIINLEAIFAIIMIPMAVAFLLIWVHYGFLVFLGSMALISFALIEIFHFAFDR
jgi:hypothetical protein